MDITEELIKVIEESWARPNLIPPYWVYLKMAYHLSHEARAGLAEFKIPRDFGNRMFDFQTAAVKIAAHHLNKRNGVLIGDVVGLGKTLMATAVARIFEDDYGLETLIICPKNLVSMWEDYAHQYRLRARVLSLSRVIGELPKLRRYRLVLIDESHNLRNRSGKRYRAIQEYIQENDSKCILLSATPYNKTYLDLSSQLRLFVDGEQDLGVRPEKLLRDMGVVNFSATHQANPRTLAAFEFSTYADDWRDLMRLYMVRRTRSFIQDNYAEVETETGRKYLTYEDGSKSFFPTRVPKTIKFTIDESDPTDRYAKLYSQAVVDVIGALSLPRYGLGTYVADSPAIPPSSTEKQQIQNLSRAGKRLIGFCRINLFKRLESSGWAFLQSVDRHILRNYVFLHAIRNGLPLPIGTQDAEMLDSRFTDSDVDEAQGSMFDPDDDQQEIEVSDSESTGMGSWTVSDFETRAAEVYAEYSKRFSWFRPDLFGKALEADLPVGHRRPPTGTPEIWKLEPGARCQAESSPEAPDRDLARQEGAVGRNGESITESQLEILSAAECRPETSAQPHHDNHHQLVADGVKHIAKVEKRVGGQLGQPSGARFRTYTRLKQYADDIEGQLFDTDALHKALDDIYRHPLRQSAVDTLNRQLRSGIDNAQLADIVITLRNDDRLCVTDRDTAEVQEPRIICSLGLFDTDREGA